MHQKQKSDLIERSVSRRLRRSRTLQSRSRIGARYAERRWSYRSYALLMLFAEFELGAVLRRETGLETPKIIRFLVGNPLIMKEMVKRVPDAGSYPPITVLIDERPDGRRRAAVFILARAVDTAAGLLCGRIRLFTAQ